MDFHFEIPKKNQQELQQHSFKELQKLGDDFFVFFRNLLKGQSEESFINHFKEFLLNNINQIDIKNLKGINTIYSKKLFIYNKKTDFGLLKFGFFFALMPKDENKVKLSLFQEIIQSKTRKITIKETFIIDIENYRSIITELKITKKAQNTSTNNNYIQAGSFKKKKQKDSF